MPRRATCFALFLLWASPVTADWSLDGNPVSTAVNGQGIPIAISDGAGGAILFWEDYRSGAADLYAQRLNAAGQPQWTPNGRAVCTAAGAQVLPVAIPDGAGGAIVVWQDERTGGNMDIYAQRLTEFGDPLWAADGVLVCGAANHQRWPTACSDSAGGAQIAWADRRLGSGYEIYAQRLNSSGVPQWATNGVVVSHGMVDRGAPVSTASGSGGAILAWTDYRNGNWDIYYRPVSAGGTPLGTHGGAPICTADGTQNGLAIASAGPAGDFGAYLAWNDLRSGADGVYAQYVTNSGLANWGANGIVVAVSGESQGDARLASDGAGGALVAWTHTNSGSSDIYGQRLNPQGEGLWSPYGLPLCTVTGSQVTPRLASDGAGGAVVAWEDFRNGADKDVYAQRVNALGQPLWNPAGVPVCRAIEIQTDLAIAGDGRGNALVAWADLRGTSPDIYAQRVEGRYGEWGHPEPAADAADDLPGDQGGAVVVRWQGSQRDRAWQPLISHYSVWRSIDLASLPAWGPEYAAEVTDPSEVGAAFAGAALWEQPTASGPVYWEWVANQPAAFLTSYGAVAPTLGDSVAGDPALHGFKVLAHDSPNPPARIWESNAVAGYSTDDLAPAAPIALAAERQGLDVRLDWSPVTSGDLRDYAIYRGTSPAVVPGPATFLRLATEPWLLDDAAPPTTLYYVVTAVDVHGNASVSSNVAHADFVLTSVDESRPSGRLTLLPVHPHPVEDAIGLRFALPRAGDVSVGVVDIAGRGVRSLRLAGAVGWQEVGITARDDSGRRLANGVYFLWMSAGGATARAKLVIAR